MTTLWSTPLFFPQSSPRLWLPPHTHAHPLFSSDYSQPCPFPLLVPIWATQCLSTELPVWGCSLARTTLLEATWPWCHMVTQHWRSSLVISLAKKEIIRNVTEFQETLKINFYWKAIDCEKIGEVRFKFHALSLSLFRFPGSGLLGFISLWDGNLWSLAEYY